MRKCSSISAGPPGRGAEHLRSAGTTTVLKTQLGLINDAPGDAVVTCEQPREQSGHDRDLASPEETEEEQAVASLWSALPNDTTSEKG